MSKALVWMRRDLRLVDHAALSYATKHHDEVYLVFVFDSLILSKLSSDDKRLTFIHDSLAELQESLIPHESSLIITEGDPISIIPKLAQELKVDSLYFNRDYGPYSIKRDQAVSKELKKIHIKTQSFKDHVIFEAHEIRNGKSEAYKVFTPYKNKWLNQLNEAPGEIYKKEVNFKALKKSSKHLHINSLDWQEKLGFNKNRSEFQGGRVEALRRFKGFLKIISDYQENRDFPAREGTSNLAPYIRHGCLSVRELIRAVTKDLDQGKKIWLSEIVWRDFYQMILSEFPYVEKGGFKTQYDSIKWTNDQALIKAWKEGQTGFPIIDSAMRCLLHSGTMPNRLRMVTASFFCKNLHSDWRIGEKHFAQYLMDFDLAANNGGWQWCSSSGTDSQPYFRIFNPYTQSSKFDSDGDFIKMWCPELKEIPSKYIHQPELLSPLEQALYSCQLGIDYPLPIINYKLSRDKTLELYKEALDKI